MIWTLLKVSPVLRFVFILLVLAAAVSWRPALAQAFSHGIDKPVPRVCRDSCVQSREQMVVDTAGNATAVWEEPYIDTDGTPYRRIYASRYTASASSWSTPVTVLGADSGKEIKLHLSPASNGRARLLYQYGTYLWGWDGSRLGMMEFVPGSGWLSRGYFGDYYILTGNIAFGSGRNGDVFVSFSEYRQSKYGEGSGDNRFVRYPANGTAWITDSGAHIPLFDKIIGDDSGGAIGIRYRDNILQVMRLDVASNSWVDLRTLDNSGYSITQLEGTADRLGNVMLIYERLNTANNTRSIRTYRFQKSSRTWTSKAVQAISSSRVYGQLAIHGDRYGNFYSAWVQYSGAYMKTIAARYSGSGGFWSKPLVISRGSYHTRDAAVTNDYAGNAIYSWSQRSDTGTGSSDGKIFRQTAVRYSNATWGTPTVIQDANRNGYKTFLGAGNDGRVTVLWTQNSSISGVKEIRSDRLIPR